MNEKTRLLQFGTFMQVVDIARPWLPDPCCCLQALDVAGLRDSPFVVAGDFNAITESDYPAEYWLEKIVIPRKEVLI